MVDKMTILVLYLYQIGGREMKNTEAHLHITMTEKLKKELEKEAIEKGLTLSMYVRMLLSERGK